MKGIPRWLRKNTVLVFLFLFLSCVTKQIVMKDMSNTTSQTGKAIAYLKDTAVTTETFNRQFVEEGELQLVERKERNGIMTQREERIMETQYAFYNE